MRSELLRRYSRTSVYSCISDVPILDDSIVILAMEENDDRAKALVGLVSARDVKMIKFAPDWTDLTKAESIFDGVSVSISLLDLDPLWKRVRSRHVYVDITGLPHNVWAPLLSSALRCHPSVWALYLEPISYQGKGQGAAHPEYMLNQRFLGLQPLPGFAKLRPSRRSVLLITQIGFDGSRAMVLAGDFDPPPPMSAILGVPGFRIDYPAESVSCNRSFFSQYKPNPVLLAAADCPFEAMGRLEQIRQDFSDCYFLVAPIGTKPHALGCILFAEKHSEQVEIVYDHPIRNVNHAVGVSALHVYSLSEM